MNVYFQKRRRDGSLVAKINGLEKELLVSSKECLILKDNLQATKEKLLTIENTSADNSEVVVALKTELEESKVRTCYRRMATTLWYRILLVNFIVTQPVKKYPVCKEPRSVGVGLLGCNTMWTCM
jgi:hypothetical protein